MNIKAVGQIFVCISRTIQNLRGFWILANSIGYISQKSKFAAQRKYILELKEIEEMQHARNYYWASICSRVMFNQKKSEKKSKEPKRNRNHDLTLLSLHFLCQFLSLSLFSSFSYFLVILEASHAFKLMFFDALEIQEPSQIDPGSI